ncbi:hypothetical protein BGW36DRAFT_284416 [Talaromyces proteolyticus]|uniref:Uncharacterized protein n=1 Tax=Talaromyces proteolyticus TaxID=1131652 RepID=A0AAD4Q695_9EURO|nr:uncharacterized protein BGW36DRAFT_284416 [Talaromyces proteolyticus]KAH8705132.1 hypothetical protein BGW36DRAFT_284416 [Talaromyces proteolyticus]
MQGLWSRTARLPSSSCKCVACLRTAANEIASRPATTAGAGRRSLRVGNALTALYSSIFAGAAIADAKAKQKRRQEWADKIAAVKEEVDELIDEERRILEVLSARNALQNTQTRLFSAFARFGSSDRVKRTRESPLLSSQTHVGGETGVEGILAKRYLSTGAHSQNGLAELRNAHIELSEVEEIEDRIVGEETVDGDFEIEEELADLDQLIQRPEPDFIWEQASITRIKAIQKVAVQQLVYRLLLRPSIVHDYSGQPVNYYRDESLDRPPSVLLSRLQTLRRRLYSLKYVQASNYDDLMQNIGIEELDAARRNAREKYDHLLKRDIKLYLQGRMQIQELLLKVADNMTSCEEPDRSSAFTMLISAFSKTHQNDLVDIVLKCLIPNLFHFSTPLIITIISHFRKTKNLKDFDQFLQMLRGEGGYSVNLRTTWRKKTVNSIEISIPPLSTFNPVILTSLIMTALRFDQPEKAEAYLHVARSQGFVDNFDTLSSYLRFYAIRRDLKNGFSTLLRALDFLTSSTDLEEKRIARLILYMTDFCERCGQEDLSSALIHAAVRSGFDCRTAHRPADSGYLLFIYEKWAKVQENFQVKDQEQLPPEKCAIFVALTEQKVTQLHENHHDNTREFQREYREAYSKVDLMRRGQPKSQTREQSQTVLPSSFDTREELSNLRRELDLIYSRIEKLSPSDSLHLQDEQERMRASSISSS